MRGPNAALGLLLVVGGLAALLLQMTGVPLDLGRLYWPYFIVIPGIVIFATGLLTATRGPLIGGAVVTTVGLILLYQDSADHYESWAYAWALIPAVSGLVDGAAASAAGDRHGAARSFRIGGAFGLAFDAGQAFFEGLVFARRPEAELLLRFGLPLLLIALGLLALLRQAGRSGRVRS